MGCVDTVLPANYKAWLKDREHQGALHQTRSPMTHSGCCIFITTVSEVVMSPAAVGVVCGILQASACLYSLQCSNRRLIL